MLLLLAAIALLMKLCGADIETSVHHVQVFHYIIHYWGTLHSGVEVCIDLETGEANVLCEFFHDKDLQSLSSIYKKAEESRSSSTRTVSLYNIHYLHQSLRRTQPNHDLLPTNLTIAESEESSVRYGYLFSVSWPHFDGYSTINPDSSVPRVYSQALLNASDFLPLKPFDKLINGASYVASDCHKRDSGKIVGNLFHKKMTLHIRTQLIIVLIITLIHQPILIEMKL